MREKPGLAASPDGKAELLHDGIGESKHISFGLICAVARTSPKPPHHKDMRNLDISPCERQSHLPIVFWISLPCPSFPTWRSPANRISASPCPFELSSRLQFLWRDQPRKRRTSRMGRGGNKQEERIKYQSLILMS